MSLPEIRILIEQRKERSFLDLIEQRFELRFCQELYEKVDLRPVDFVDVFEKIRLCKRIEKVGMAIE
jgi:hypothetical protein